MYGNPDLDAYPRILIAHGFATGAGSILSSFDMDKWRKREGTSDLGEGILFPHEEQGPIILGKHVSVLCGRRDPRNLHRHEQFQLIVTFDKSAAEITWENQGSLNTTRVVSRQFCIIPPYTNHSCRWTRHAEVVILYLDCAALSEHTRHAPNDVVFGDLKKLCLGDPLLYPLADTLRNLTAQATSAAASSLGLTLCARLLDGLHKLPEIVTPSAARLAPSVLEKISAYIDANLKDEITVDLLARQAGLSSVHFARLFKNSAGTTPTQYIAKRRVEKALVLLETGEFRVAEAACEVGFYDQSHLDRHCRKFFGQPPRLLIKSALKAS